MRFGILGCQHAHIEMFVQEMLQLGHTFIGIWEEDPVLAAPMAQKYQVPLFEEKAQLFEGEPEVVGTSAINDAKIDLIEECSNRGIHVMADKPIVTSRADFLRLERIMDQGQIEVGLMLTERFNPPIYTLWRRIQEGDLGKLVSLTITKPHKLQKAKRPRWHFSKEQNGGILIDLLIHDFDLLRWFTGSELEYCSGYLKKTAHPEFPDFYDSVHLLVRMRNKVVASLEADWWMPDSHWTWGDGRIFCVGTEGRAEIRTTGDFLVDRQPFGTLVTKDGKTERLPLQAPDRTLTEDFIKRITGEGESILTGEDILEATRASILADEVVEIIR
ncbi:MAG: Gfo/Idh/MocA family protein [Clostridia bacterium]|jgi:predicted dehydrogenase